MWSAEVLVRELKKGHVHDWAPADTITVKELREAYMNVEDAFDEGTLLRYISEHREPEYKPGTVWKDSVGVIWLRGQNKSWTRCGSVCTHNDGAPRRPLTPMVEVPF
jgi:hypothetical protein